MLLNLADQPGLALRGNVDVLLRCGRSGTADGDRVVDLRKLVGEDRLDHDSLDLLDPPGVARLSS